jgi:hypothetical protein
MRAVLLDPSKSEEEQFAVWRRDMPDNLSDEEIMDLMQKAKDRLVKAHAPVVRGKKGVAERMMPAGNFAGTPKHKLGSAAHLKGKMKRPARAGDLVGDVEEGLGSKLAGLGLAGAMAFGAGGANARVSGDQDPSINRLTGKPNVTQSVPANVKPAATTPAGFNKEYLQSVIDGKHPRPLISKEKAADILMKMNAVDEAKIKGADGKACWKGYKYAGTKNGKDKCVPIGEAYETEMYKAIALLEGINIKPSDVHNIADKKGIPWDNDRKFLNLSKKLTGKSHLDKMSSDELRIVYNYIRKIR